MSFVISNLPGIPSPASRSRRVDPEDDGGENGDAARDDAVRDGSALPSFTLFIDGISKFANYYHIQGLFGQIGSLKNVFVQKRRRIRRDFRFGFVCYSSLKLTSLAISLFNGALGGGSSLSEALAKFPRTGGPSQNEVVGRPPFSSALAGGFGTGRSSKAHHDKVFSTDEERMILGLPRVSPFLCCPPAFLFPETLTPGCQDGGILRLDLMEVARHCYQNWF